MDSVPEWIRYSRVMDDQKSTGLYRKFLVHRVDGRDQPGGDREGAEYIVLDLTYCDHSRTAALAYADAVEQDYPILAESLRVRIASLPPVPA